MIVKGKTKSGYSFKIDSRVKDSRDLMRIWTAIQTETDSWKQVDLTNKLAVLILGSEENVDKLEEKIKEQNDGYCTNTDFWAEINEIIEALNAKNS